MESRSVVDHQSVATMTLKLGIWCDYGVTLEPSEGIGVFVANLVQGLAPLSEVSKIVLVSKDREEHLLAPLSRLDPAKIQVVGNRKPPFHLRKPWKFLRKIDRLSIEKHGKGIEPTSFSGKLYDWLSRRIDRTKAQWIESVDLWLLPYVGLDQNFSKPTVVIVHDLVTYHFPDGIADHKLAAFKRLVDQVTHRASLVACMSDFILHQDLLGTLGLPEEKTRMVRPAVPKDFSGVSQGLTPIPKVLQGTSYLLYPAAFRSYKNHALLLSALPLINRNRPQPLHLVFTGITQTPNNLKRLIDDLGIESQVHVLGKVPRGELESLYKHAYATTVPSLYEQGSFPLLEALSFGCPILASDIPSLREQLGPMLDDAIFFDPHSADSFVEAFESLESDRVGTLVRQLAGFERMKKRTWQDAACQWCEVFRQAIRIAGNHRV